MADPEIEAMSVVSDALADLDEDAQRRVLRWATERFNVTFVAKGPDPQPQESNAGDEVDDQVFDEPISFEHFGELFAAANPKSNEDKALVAAYWAQVVEGAETWQSRRLNSDLKDLGHSLPNITTALTSNMRKRPQRVIQIRKSGNAKQSNKTYKVTREGVMYVQGMLGGGTI